MHTQSLTAIIESAWSWSCEIEQVRERAQERERETETDIHCSKDLSSHRTIPECPLPIYIRPTLYSRSESRLMSDDKLETTVPSTTTSGNDDLVQTNPLAAAPSLPTPPSPTAPMSSTKLGSLTNRILSPSDMTASPVSTNSSSPSHISPNKSSCHSSSAAAATTRRTFNICDILAKPSSSSVDTNNNPRSNHSIDKQKAHRFTGHPKKIREAPTKAFNESKSHSNKKPLYSHSDDDDEDDEDDDDVGHPGSISDCDVSGMETVFSSRIASNLCLLFFCFRWMSVRSRW